jgi:hypothetical protein
LAAVGRDNQKTPRRLRRLHDTPLILAGGNFRDGLLDWAKAAMLRPDRSLASPEDLNISRVATDSADIVHIIREHHANWKRIQGAP